MTRTEGIEWGAGAVSALVVTGIVGFLVYQAAFGGDALPDLRVTAEPVLMEDGRTHLRYAVSNAGDRTAAAVTLSLTLSEGAGQVAERSVTLDYVPPHSQVTGGLYLPDAEGFELDLSIEGYADP